MNSLFPSIVSRSQSSGLMNFFVPIISIVLTLITGSIIFVLLGFDPVYALYTFFISPISSTYGISELFVKATPLALIAIGLSYCFKNNIYNIEISKTNPINKVITGIKDLMTNYK